MMLISILVCGMVASTDIEAFTISTDTSP